VLWASAFCVFCFAGLVSLGLAWDRTFPLMRFDSPYRAGVPDVSREWYLSADRDALDYDVLYNGWWGTVPALRQADVLFLGNSRALYAFRPEYFQPYLDQVGLRGYNLSAAGGSYTFPTDIIRKFDLKPKLLVISGESFDGDSRFSVWARERSAWESWRFYYEYVASWSFRKHLHLWLPPWQHYLLDDFYQVWYRSALTGGTSWPLALDGQNPITLTTPLPLDPQQQAIVDRELPKHLKNLLAWRDEMAARGAMTVLALPPYPDHLSYFLTREMEARSGVPFIDEWPLGLMGQAGSHMDGPSAGRWLSLLMPRLLAHPGVRAHLGLAAAP
jgi:hypothetical protein